MNKWDLSQERRLGLTLKITVIHHIKKPKERNHMIISVDEGI